MYCKSSAADKVQLTVTDCSGANSTLVNLFSTLYSGVTVRYMSYKNNKTEYFDVTAPVLVTKADTITFPFSLIEDVEDVEIAKSVISNDE